MFEESLVESAHILRTQSRWPAIASITLQAALALTLISLPMLHPELLSLRTPLISLLTPPRPIPPPPPVRIHVVSAPTTNAAVSAPTASTSLPSSLDRSTIAAANPAAPDLHPTGIMPGESTGLTAALGAPQPAIHVTTTPTNTPRAHLNLSTGVSAGLLLSPLRPVYPQIAVAAHQEGTVIVQAIISRTGVIESAHVLSGPAMLQQAALEAVRSARYRPYLLNHEPTEVDTTFNINFRLRSFAP